ncbi:MAG: hypothetical protein KH441_11370, partial [Clostridium sp.]|nr:hypothetical protein [Clostridium sp.]
MVQIRAIRPPKAKDLTLFLRTLFLRTERQIIDEITRKRAAGYVDYAEVAALERVQRILQTMVDESWSYVPQMIEKIFYHSDKHAAGYANARALTASQTAVVQQLSNNLLGEILEASETAYQTAQEFFTIARLEADPYRKAALTQTVAQEALGTGWKQTSAKMAAELRNQGLTGFVDKAGRKWTLSNYCNMATRTTARQAEVAAVLTADDYDLWQIVKIGSTCPVCAPLEGRVYSKSGTNPDYPPLSLAFGKVDPDGGDDLTNTYLNIHPNCLHSLIRYTMVGKTEKQIQRDKDFSDPKKNPLSRDPRTKKQIAAYREKERNRQKFLRDMKQHKEYREILGNEIPKDFEKFQKMKYTEGERFELFRKKVENLEQARRFKEKLKNGSINTAVRNVKQQEHIQGTKKWRQRVRSDLETKGTAPDMFYKNVDVQKLVDEYSGTGEFEFRKNQQYPIEYISVKKPIGKYFNLGKGRYEETKRFAIRYSSKGVHLHPVKEV